MAGLRHALSIASLFVIHLLSEHEVSGAKNKRTTGQGLSYANFVRDAFHHLNATIVGSSLVSKVSACNLACVDEPSCVSFNVGAKPVDNFGHLLCELLATDKYNASDQFHENPDFHYYSIYVSSVGTHTDKSKNKTVFFFVHDFDRVNSVQRPVFCSLSYMRSRHVLQTQSILYYTCRPLAPRILARMVRLASLCTKTTPSSANVLQATKAKSAIKVTLNTTQS